MLASRDLGWWNLSSGTSHIPITGERAQSKSCSSSKRTSQGATYLTSLKWHWSKQELPHEAQVNKLLYNIVKQWEVFVCFNSLILPETTPPYIWCVCVRVCVCLCYKLSKLECRIHKTKTSNLRTEYLYTAYHMPGSAQSM